MFVFPCLYFCYVFTKWMHFLLLLLLLLQMWIILQTLWLSHCAVKLMSHHGWHHLWVALRGPVDVTSRLTSPLSRTARSSWYRVTADISADLCLQAKVVKLVRDKLHRLTVAVGNTSYKWSRKSPPFHTNLHTAHICISITLRWSFNMPMIILEVTLDKVESLVRPVHSSGSLQRHRHRKWQLCV